MFVKGEILFVDTKSSLIHKNKVNGFIIGSQDFYGLSEIYKTIPQNMLLIVDLPFNKNSRFGFDIDSKQIVTHKEFHLFDKTRVKRLISNYPSEYYDMEFDSIFIYDFINIYNETKNNQVFPAFVDFTLSNIRYPRC